MVVAGGYLTLPALPLVAMWGASCLCHVVRLTNGTGLTEYHIELSSAQLEHLKHFQQFISIQISCSPRRNQIGYTIFNIFLNSSDQIFNYYVRLTILLKS